MSENLYLLLVGNRPISYTGTNYVIWFIIILLVSFVLLYLLQYKFRDSPTKNSGKQWWFSAIIVCAVVIAIFVGLGKYILKTERIINSNYAIAFQDFFIFAIICGIIFLVIYCALTFAMLKIFNGIPFSIHNRRTTFLGVK